MGSICPLPLTYSELFSEPSRNTFGSEEDKTVACIASVYLNWRTTGDAPDVDDIEDDIISNFYRPIGGVGIFVENERSLTGILQVMHGFEKFPGVPGKTGRAREQLFCYVGDVTGLDLQNIAFNGEQLKNTSSVSVPVSLDLVLQLLGGGTQCNNEGALPCGRCQRAHTHEHARCHVYTITIHGTGIGHGVDRPGGLPTIIACCRQRWAAASVQAARTVQPRIGIRDFYPSPAVVNHRWEHVPYQQLPGM
jgi:hypothetical protein